MLKVKFIYSAALKLVEGLVSIILTVTVIVPFLSLLWILNSTVRLLVRIHLRFKYSGAVQLSGHGSDNMWGYQSRTGGNSRNVLFTAVYNERIDGARYRSLFQSKVIEYTTPEGTQPYRKLTKIFSSEDGYYCWRDDPDFDISNHVLVYSEDRVWTESEFLELLSTLSSDMDETHPQWQEIIIPKFRYDVSKSKMLEREQLGNGAEQSLRILRFHHAYGDAGSWLLLYSYCMADGKIPYAVNPLKGFPVPKWQIILYYVTALIFGTTTMIKAIWYGTNVRTNRLVTPKYTGNKTYLWADLVELSTLKAIKNQTKVPIPTILSAVIAGALRTFDDHFTTPNSKNPKSNQMIPDYTDIGAVAAILPYPRLDLVNRYTIANFTIPTGSMGRRERLNETHKLFMSMSKSPEPLLNYWAFNFFGLLPIRIHNVLMRSCGTSLIFSNLPGASSTFYLLADAVDDGGAWVPLLTVAGLSLSANGYKNGIRFCASTDSACMSKTELEFFLDSLKEEIKLLYEDTVGVV